MSQLEFMPLAITREMRATSASNMSDLHPGSSTLYTNPASARRAREEDPWLQRREREKKDMDKATRKMLVARREYNRLCCQSEERQQASLTCTLHTLVGSKPITAHRAACTCMKA